MTSPLFMSGTARGGTNLTTMMLSVHPGVSLSQDPFLPLFKSLRNAMVKHRMKTQPADFDPESPLDEYYFFDHKLEILKLIQGGSLDIPFSGSELSSLLESLAKRMALSSPLLIPYLSELRGDTYLDLFKAALRIVRLGRKSPDVKWLGFNDNWTAEFFPALARSFPEARFVLILRDMRASIASNRMAADPKVRPLILSFARHWRKQLALAHHYQKMKLFQDRFHMVTYEQLVAHPQLTAQKMCDFLQIDFSPDMLDTNNFVGPNGKSWVPNSNIDPQAPKTGIYQSSVDQWKTKLPLDVIRQIEFTAGPDLEFSGYKLTEEIEKSDFYESVYRCLSRDDQECEGWRTDNSDPTVDFALELLRKHCLKHPTTDNRLIEHCFLYPEIYESLLNRKGLLP